MRRKPLTPETFAGNQARIDAHVATFERMTGPMFAAARAKFAELPR